MATAAMAGSVAAVIQLTAGIKRVLSLTASIVSLISFIVELTASGDAQRDEASQADDQDPTRDHQRPTTEPSSTEKTPKSAPPMLGSPPAMLGESNDADEHHHQQPASEREQAERSGAAGHRKRGLAWVVWPGRVDQAMREPGGAHHHLRQLCEDVLTDPLR